MIRFGGIFGRSTIAIATLVLSAILLFARLGHYALWDDEAYTALIAQGVWRTGDTSAVLGKNLVAYRNGAELENLKVRYMPPLQYYIAAPFVGPNDPSSFLARLPFAFLGLLSVALLLRWARREGASTLTTLIFAIAIMSNVSLMLYFRQCRYYALVIFLSIAVAYLYRFFSGGRIQLALMFFASLALFASNYLSYAALYGCLAVDYSIWGRARYRLGWRQLLGLLLPQIVFGALIALTWNPLGKYPGATGFAVNCMKKFRLVWGSLRDGTACEFWVAPLIIAALVIAWCMPQKRVLARLSLAAALYLLLINIFSPQTIVRTGTADVRYLTPMIPLCIAIETLVVATVSFGRWWIALPMALLAFGTNLLNGGRHTHFPDTPRQIGSTFCQYVGELLHPPNDPYTQTAAWINTRVAEGESIWVVLDYQTFPLMYHAPRAVYAWQLTFPPAAQFSGLDPIQFRGQGLPDYVVAAGPMVPYALGQIHFGSEGDYTLATRINCFWKDRFRPELIWRRFSPMPTSNRDTDAIYILRRTSKIEKPAGA